VAVLVPNVRWADRHADGKERQQCGDEIGAGMKRLRNETQAVRGKPRAELQRDQHSRGHDRDESGSALGAHAA